MPNSSEPNLTLSYAPPETQFGMIFERLADGGVRIVIPGTFGSELRARLADSSHPLIALAVLIVCAFDVLLRRPIPHRAVIELTRETLTVLDRRIGQMPQSWPRSELAEIRPNRYARGLYVRIPGKQNFDVLTDLSPPLLAAIGRALDEARGRLDQYSPPQAAQSHLE